MRTRKLAGDSWPNAIIMILALSAATGCGRRAPATSAAVIVPPSKDWSIARRIQSLAAVVPAEAMASPGLAGALGGIHVRFLRGGTFDMRIPIPQAVDGQVPVWYGVTASSPTIPVAFFLHRKEGGNSFVKARLVGTQNQEAVITWSAVILIAGRAMIENRARPEDYRAASPCAQSDAEPIRELASRLWPAAATVERYPRSIQQHILGMEPRERIWSLDALGVLKSGQTGICTANANLACALLRAKGIPCRSLAVIPPISRRLEMHRIVEYFAGNGWMSFDPSLLQKDLPLKPWQGIIMAKSSMADEEASMRPRIGAMPGCPYGQEAEIAQLGLSLHGNDFFWTLAVPLARFAVNAAAFDLTRREWEGFLNSGICRRAQADAAWASDLARYVTALKGN